MAPDGTGTVVKYDKLDNVRGVETPHILSRTEANLTRDALIEIHSAEDSPSEATGARRFASARHGDDEEYRAYFEEE